MNTKTFLPIFASLSLLAASAVPAAAQCPFDPTVTGNLLVCPQAATTLSTQPSDSYQWYRRSYPNGTAMPISGATGPTLEVVADDTPVYISVRTTQGGCSEQSPEVLVDGLAFLPVTVLSDGEFTIGPNGEQVICVGDTVFLVALLPYTINFQWYNGQDSIPGAQDDTLVVTQPGNFWLTASPGECPNYTASLGLEIPVIWGDTPGCTPTSVTEPAPPFEAVVMPNPAQESFLIGVDVPGTVRLSLVNPLGQEVRHTTFTVTTEVPVHDLPAGAYVLLLQHAAGSVTKQVVVQR